MIDYKLKKYKLSKSIKIKISNSGEVLVSAPIRASKKECEAFVALHLGWIYETLQKVEYQNSQNRKISENRAGEVLYFGEWLPLEVDEKIRQKYLISNDKLVLKKNDLAGFYKSEAKKLFESKCAEIAPFYGVSYSKIRIGSPKTRWGSCSSSGTLSFNQNLIKAPRSISEYVVIHEICHMLEPNHSTHFWNQVAKLCPDFRSRRAWLWSNHLELTV